MSSSRSTARAKPFAALTAVALVGVASIALPSPALAEQPRLAASVSQSAAPLESFSVDGSEGIAMSSYQAEAVVSMAEDSSSAVASRAVPWLVARCLLGLGLNWATIAQIAATPTYGGIQAAFGYAAARCLMGRAG